MSDIENVPMCVTFVIGHFQKIHIVELILWNLSGVLFQIKVQAASPHPVPFITSME